MTVPPAVYLEYYLMVALFAVVWVSLGYWIYADATARGSSSALSWAFGTMVFIPTGVYYHLFYRRSHERDVPQTRRERVAGILAVSGIVTTVASAMLTPPDSLTQLQFMPAAFAVTVLVLFLFERRIGASGS